MTTISPEVRTLRRALDLRVSVARVATAYRVIDGEADGAPGIELDRFGTCWLFQGRSAEPPAPAWVEAVVGAGAAAVYWKRLETGTRRAPVFLAGVPVAEPFEVAEHGARFLIDFAAGYSQGLFLDQRDNRARVADWCAAHPGASLLNTFAYTCAFGVVAGRAGAHTVNLDLSPRALDWGRENYRLNALDPDAHRFVAGDVFDWLRRFARKGRRFDLVVVDPPTFSRNRAGAVFRVARDLPMLVRAASAVVRSGGVLLISCNQRSLDGRRFRQAVEAGLVGRRFRLGRLPMPPDFRGDPYLHALWAQEPDPSLPPPSRSDLDRRREEGRLREI